MSKKSKLAKMYAEMNSGIIRIVKVDDECIEFSNGSRIEFDHSPDCCEWNYADFSQLEELARKTVFTLPLTFEAVDECGFRFGNYGKMFFVPCYSEQNGYYSCDIDIYFNHHRVLNLECNEIDQFYLFF